MLTETWVASTSLRTDLALGALEFAFFALRLFLSLTVGSGRACAGSSISASASSTISSISSLFLLLSFNDFSINYKH